MADKRAESANGFIALCTGFELSEYKGLLVLQLRSKVSLPALVLARADECNLCDALQRHLSRASAVVLTMAEHAH